MNCASIRIDPGLMVAQFAKFLRNLPVEADIQLNLLAAEWSVGATTDHGGPRTVACRS
ncbi:MAG TPA: hypothetical protein VJZ71_08255 [Phycisphaerae bacterium]|nr:hypothetical protein [Phycisphaerae bacterium]